MQRKTVPIKELSGFIQNWKQQLNQGLRLGLELKKSLAPDRHIVVAGMGGSIIAAEIVSNLLEQEPTKTPHLEIWENYSLPRRLPKNSLVICSSYSGDTQETLSAFKKAKALELPILVLAQNGKLKQLAENNHYPLALIPESSAPRFALFYFLGILLQIFAGPKLVSRAKSLKLDFQSLDQKAQQLARRIGSKNVLLYATNSFRALAHFWEIALDESAKTPSFVNLLPGSEHHDLASFSGKKQQEWLPLFLKNPHDSSALKRSLDLTLRAFRADLGMRPVLLESRSADPLKQIAFHSLLAQLTGLKLAQQKKINPLENLVQEGLKKKLTQKRSRK